MYSTNRTDRLGDLINARKYFSHAAILKETDAKSQPCVRALFGLVKACKAIEGLNKKEDPKNKEILEVAQRNIRELYASKAQDRIRLGVQTMASL